MNAGYIMQFEGRGQYAPEGKVEPPVEDVNAHNTELDLEMLEYMKQTGTGILYLSKSYDTPNGPVWEVSTWLGTFKYRLPDQWLKRSWHNMAGQNGRTDVWFVGPDGLKWHGVNIGDNQILRCKRLKKQ